MNSLSRRAPLLINLRGTRPPVLMPETYSPNPNIENYQLAETRIGRLFKCIVLPVNELIEIIWTFSL